MPPRKKTVDADGNPPAPLRSSSRIKAATATAPVPAPTPAPAAPASKPTRVKRARAGSEVDEAPKKPATKRTKNAGGSSKKDDAMNVDGEPEHDKTIADAQVDALSADDTPDGNVVDEKDDKATATSQTDDQADSKKAGKKKAADDDEPKKMVTVVKRGAAPVDPYCGRHNTHMVYSNTEAVWDAMLNQTNVTHNNNKFYVLQLQHPINSTNSVTLFTRWGRVGENGQSQNKGPFDPATAVREFKKQFKTKAGVDWDKRVGMTPKAGKYFWIERDYEEDEKEEEKKDLSDSKKEIKVPDSALEPAIQEACRLIFNQALIDAHLSSMNYDANKLPLGKLSKKTILNGFNALKNLSDVISNPVGDVAKSHGGAKAATEHFTNVYYSIIPHDFGRNRPLVIQSEAVLKKELDLVDALGDMEIASKLIASTIPLDDEGNPINPLDAKFRSLNLTSMEVVSQNSDEFSSLNKYVQDTHGRTHQHLNVQILQAYRVERASEVEAWNKAGHDKLGAGEHMLLWHGSRSTNFAGILSQGLRIAPPEAPVTGYMFGKGVYFADMMSKSANYCYAYLSGGTGLLLLCDVAVKPFVELTNADYHADVTCKKANAMATKGIGRTQPTQWKDAGDALTNPSLKGCLMPDSPGVDVNPPGAYLQYNEYIVYDTAQIKVKYMLMVKM